MERATPNDKCENFTTYVDTNKAVCEFEHVVSERNDDELGIPRPLFDVVGNNRHVFEVQGSVDLVHDIKRRWFEMMKSKNKSQR